MSDTKKRKWIIATLAAGFGLLLFFGYRLLYMAGVSEYAKEFTAGCIGAVITIAATAALLKSQTDSEIVKEQLAEVFKQKLELYQSFIQFLNSIQADGVIDTDELNQVVEWGGRLSLVSRPG